MVNGCFLSVFKAVTLRPNLTQVYSQPQNIFFYGLTVQVRPFDVVRISDMLNLGCSLN